jgi:hypothetical protein
MTAEPRIEWAHCNSCNRHTRHKLLHEEKFRTDDEADGEYSFTSWDDYKLLQCMGCETVHLQHDSRFSEEIGPDGQLEVTKKIYPPRVSRSKPAWLGDLGGPFWIGETEIEQLLEEIYVALHDNSLRLATLGIRALLEFIMVDKIGDHGSIGQNISKFFEAGFVAPVDQETFRNKLIEAGHAAMHRGYKPSASDLGTLLDLTETLIASIYVHPERAKALTKRIPKRKRSKTRQA